MRVSKTQSSWVTCSWQLAVLLAAVGCGGSAQDRVVLPPPQRSTILIEPHFGEVEKQRFEESFEHVWTTVRDRHWDPDMGGVDWQAVHDELLPELRAASTADEAREVLIEMLARLGESHYAIVPSDVYDDVLEDGAEAVPSQEEGDGTEEMEEPNRSGQGQPGFDVRYLEGQMVVVSVEKDSAAERAGIRSGWVIAKVGGRDLDRALRGIEAEYDERGLTSMYARIATLGRLSGEVGDEVTVEFRDGDERSRTIEVELMRPQGELTQLGHMPAVYASLWSERMAGDVGYVALNIFMDPARISTAFGTAVQEFMESPGIIVDLRGNPGGIGFMATGLAGWFIEESGAKLGTMIMRDTELKFVVFPRAETYAGKLAILVDECSASTSEIYAQGMKDLERARVFGTRTAGAALPSQFERLPTGDGFQYAVADYISEGGTRLEGAGVTPDQEIRLTRAKLLDGEDSVLEAALQWVRQSASN